MSPPLTHRLYLRIWLAVVAAVLLLTLLFGWLWRLEAERERAQRPGREIILRNAQGEIVGQAVSPVARVPGQGWEFIVPLRDGQTLQVQLPRPSHLPPPMATPSWWRPPYHLLALLMVIAVAVALGAYPIVRRLTKRLETLQQGVERWGEGDLAQRLPAQGGDEVAFLARRFNTAADRVQALLLAHKALLAHASHELRSPLARIRMGLELLPHPSAQSTGKAETGRAFDAAREEIARNVRELDLLIEEILLASRLDANPQAVGALESVDLVGLCAEECARCGAELDLAPPTSSLIVHGSPRLLRRAVRNLLENAGRHGSGSVQLVLQLRDGYAVVRVLDQGPGVPAEFRERIFEPFFRLPGASERDGGVGLGLALVRSIAQRHGGSACCREPQDSGACFELTLPLAHDGC